jgi:DNA-binding LytR/AlgR family response regulator
MQAREFLLNLLASHTCTATEKSANLILHLLKPLLGLGYNMRVFIVEDEAPAANRLSKMILSLYPATEIAGRADSIESAVRFLSVNNNDIDLIFMDIQLADGLSFDIFNYVQPSAPVIFTTAFDQYTLKAFKVNSIDYLLKPIDETELKQAIQKHLQINARNNHRLSQQLVNILSDFNKPKYRERLMIKRGSQFINLKTSSIAYCYADGKLCFAVDFAGPKFLVENTLSQMEEELNPSHFYRINRHMIVNIEAIQKVHTWLGGRLKLDVSTNTTVDTVVSREKVNEFKDWFGGTLTSG